MCAETIIAAMIGLAGSAGSAMLAGKPADPPPLPARVPDATKAPGATVRVGSKEDGTSDDTMQQPVVNTDKRMFGKPVGGLGMSGLSI